MVNVRLKWHEKSKIISQTSKCQPIGASCTLSPSHLPIQRIDMRIKKGQRDKFIIRIFRNSHFHCLHVSLRLPFSLSLSTYRFSLYPIQGGRSSTDPWGRFCHPVVGSAPYGHVRQILPHPPLAPWTIDVDEASRRRWWPMHLFWCSPPTLSICFEHATIANTRISRSSRRHPRETAHSSICIVIRRRHFRFREEWLPPTNERMSTDEGY